MVQGNGAISFSQMSCGERVYALWCVPTCVDPQLLVLVFKVRTTGFAAKAAVI